MKQLLAQVIFECIQPILPPKPAQGKKGRKVEGTSEFPTNGFLSRELFHSSLFHMFSTNVASKKHVNGSFPKKRKYFSAISCSLRYHNFDSFIPNRCYNLAGRAWNSKQIFGGEILWIKSEKKTRKNIIAHRGYEQIFFEIFTVILKSFSIKNVLQIYKKIIIVFAWK